MAANQSDLGNCSPDRTEAQPAASQGGLFDNGFGARAFSRNSSQPVKINEDDILPILRKAGLHKFSRQILP